MSTRDFICVVLGLYDGSCKKIDEICENFYLDICTERVNEWIKLRGENENLQLGNLIIGDLYRNVISDAIKSFGECMEEDMFECDVNDICSHLYYNGETIYNWEDLERIAEELQAEQEEEEEEEEELIPMF